MKIRVVMTGRDYHAAEPLPDELDLADNASVDDALAQLSAALPQDQSLPASCLIAVAGEHLGTVTNHQPRALRDGDELVLISPVAGG